MTTFYWIRHGWTDAVGETLSGWTPGIHLNEEGRLQANRIPERFRQIPLDAVFSSPLERCVETAEPLAALFGLTIQLDAALGEVRFGSWTGQRISALQSDPLWQRYNASRSLTRIPDGEMAIEVQARMVAWIADAARAYRDGAVAVISHRDPIRSVIAHCCGMPLDLLDRIEISPASVSVTRISEYSTVLLTMNNTESLS